MSATAMLVDTKAQVCTFQKDLPSKLLRALTRSLKLLIIFERGAVPNGSKYGLKLYKMVQTGNFFAHQKQKLPVKMTSMTGPS